MAPGLWFSLCRIDVEAARHGQAPIENHDGPCLEVPACEIIEEGNFYLWQPEQCDAISDLSVLCAQASKKKPPNLYVTSSDSDGTGT